MTQIGAFGGRIPAAWAGARRTARDVEMPMRMVAFAALAAYVTSAWLGMVVHPPAGRGLLLVGIMVAAGAALSVLGPRRWPRLAAYPLAGAACLAFGWGILGDR